MQLINKWWVNIYKRWLSPHIQYFTAYLLYFLLFKNRGERQKRITDCDSTIEKHQIKEKSSQNIDVTKLGNYLSLNYYIGNISCNHSNYSKRKFIAFGITVG